MECTLVLISWENPSESKILIRYDICKEKRCLRERNSIEREVATQRSSQKFQSDSHTRVNVCVYASDFLSEDYWREIKIALRALVRAGKERTMRGIRMWYISISCPQERLRMNFLFICYPISLYYYLSKSWRWFIVYRAYISSNFFLRRV